MRALLVIDMLKDFIYKDGALPVNGAKKLISPINEKIREFRGKNEPVIFICDSHDEMDEEFDVWGRHAVEGTKGAEIIDELDRREYDIVVTKKRFSAFYNTDLEKTLRGLNVDTLIITGVLTDICVLHTAADAAMRGFKVIVPENCVATVDEEKQKWVLRHIKEVLGGRID
ncbi:MAG TPA: cysteine hydrolase [Euryarchaeota archaeon]|nr:isochorismatase family protein YecD [archaeon BMS3Bbin15]HDL14879.1 cysteine hydrolase [Euryarchaeota archaeon]